MTNSNRLSTRRKFLFAFIAICIPLLLLESVLRVGKTVVEDLSPSEDWYVYDEATGWVPRPNYQGTIIKGTRKFDRQGYMACDSAQVADEQIKRIVVIGNSTAMGYGVDAERSFAERVDRQLPDQAVINLGVNGYSTLQTAIRLEQALEELHPQTVIVSCSFNDRRYVVHNAEVDSVEKFRQIRKLKPRWYDWFYVVRGMKKVLVQDPTGPPTASLDDLLPRVGPEAFRENLLRMADAAKRHQAQLYFLVLPDNPAKTRDLNKGLAKLAEGDHDSAIKLFQQVIEDGNMFSDVARIQLAEVYRLTGQDDLAQKTLQVQKPLYSLHGGRPILLERQYAEIIRSVASETGAVAIEAGGVLNESPGVFIDFCHFDEIGNRLIADLILEQLTETASQPDEP